MKKLLDNENKVRFEVEKNIEKKNKKIKGE